MTDQNELGMFEVKTHFSQVVARVLRDKRRITVTRNGKPVVDIVPTEACRDEVMSREDALEALEALQAEIGSAPLSYDEIQSITAESRDRCPDV